MESRWRFLHYNITELWGHRGKARAGNGETGASIYPAGRQIPQQKVKYDAYRTKVGKLASQLSRKAAIVCIVPVP